MNRLHVSEITSVGAVEEDQGDNPLSTITLWKSRPPKSTTVVVGSTSGGDRGNAVEKVRVMKETENLAASKTVMLQAQRSIDEIRSMTKGTHMNKRSEGRSSAVILAEVDRLASNIQKSAGGTTKAAAKAEVWSAHPELKTEVRKAQSRERDAGREAGKDIAATIDRIVKSYCLSISAERENMAKTLTQIRNDVMHTAAGLEIKKLRAAAMAGQVGSETEIQKSAEYADAWTVLKNWDK